MVKYNNIDNELFQKICEVKVSVITKNAFIYEAIIHILKKIAIPHIRFIIKKMMTICLIKILCFMRPCQVNYSYLMPNL